jgi:serine/threonine-protein kinase
MAVSELQDRLQETIGDTYRIERELGAGGMSYVFLAVETGLSRRVVIKVLAPELTNDVMTARFRREMEVTALLQHPHILPVLTTGTRDGLFFYVTPFVEGESLRHRLEREGTLPIDDVIRILSEVSSALAYAHERGVVHRDIKPENVLLSNGLAVLADFGISGVLAGRSETPGGARLTDVGMSLGTPGYMSPEQAAGERELDSRSDQYSLAVVGYEMLTGKPPFTGTTPLSVMTAHLTEVPKPVEASRVDAPPGVARALARALSKKPEERFPSLVEFRQSLGVSWSGRNAAIDRPSRGRWALVAGAAVAAAALGWFLLRPAAATGMDDSLVAIAPFDAVGADDAMWREGLVDLLAANLDGAGPLRTVSPSVVIQRWKDSRADRPSALALANATGAGITVFGSVVSAGRDSVRIRATVLDSHRDTPIGRPIDYADEATRLDRISDSLTFAILNRLNEARGLGATRSASLGTSSVAAIKAYLVGEQFYRRGNWDSAAVHYREAVETDSAFAPAYRRLGNAIGWTLGPNLGIQREAYEMNLRAGRLNVGLAPRESLLVAADSISAALFIGGLRPLEQFRLTKRVTDLLEEGVQRFPDDPEVWFKLGDARAHFSIALLPSRTNVVNTAEAFARSIDLDSAFGPSYIHYFSAVAEAQDLQGLRSSMRAFLALGPDDQQGEAVRYLLPVIDGRVQAGSDADTALQHLSPAARVNAMAWMFPLMDSGETQVALLRDRWRQLQDQGVTGGQVIGARIQLASALALRGHYDSSLAFVDDNTYWLMAEAAMAGALDRDSAARVFGRWLDEASGVKALVGSVFWADVGDTANLKRAMSHAEALRRSSPTGVPLPLMRGLLAIARRDTATAIRELTLPDSACAGWCMQARLPLARMLSHAGRDSAAAELLSQDFPQPTGLKVLWALERGRVNERLGRTGIAVDAYTFVARAWRNGDLSVQPVVREAQAGLDRLAPDRVNR